jgi:hypothetical protein
MASLKEGIELAKEAQESKLMYRAKMQAIGYSYLSGGEYEEKWAYWVHPDFLILAKKHACYGMLDEDAIAKELGLEELPEGAVLDDNF